jgi:hypothetical protein
MFFWSNIFPWVPDTQVKAFFEYGFEFAKIIDKVSCTGVSMTPLWYAQLCHWHRFDMYSGVNGVGRRGGGKACTLLNYVLTAYFPLPLAKLLPLTNGPKKDEGWMERRRILRILFNSCDWWTGLWPHSLSNHTCGIPESRVKKDCNHVRE